MNPLDSLSDRALLELAAKAAGLKIYAARQAERDAAIDPATASLWLTSGHTGWNPRTNNSDALSLAVKLNMAISIHDHHCMACAQTGTMQTVSKHGTTAESTRRAIVLAAADVGMAMVLAEEGA